MVQKIHLLVMTGMSLMLMVLTPRQLSAQDFSECQRIVKELLPLFNKSFEENNPALLRGEEYQRGVRNLQAAYAIYHKQTFQPSDSVQRMNNEAVILALSGNYQKALHIMETLDLGEGDPHMHYNRGLFALLSGKFEAARNDFSDSPNGSEATLNTLVALGKQKKYQEAASFANDNSAKNTGGKWNFNVGMVHKYSGRMEEAVDELTTAIRQKDEMAYRLQRGDILMRTGNEKAGGKGFRESGAYAP
jgi:tetratricopeptide (TPR) repeat protein